MPPEKNMMKKIQTCIPTKIIFLDMAIDQQDIYVKKLKGYSDILVIDHHKISKNINDERVVHFNPRYVKKDIYQSTSYLAYKTVSEIINIEDLLWIAGVGMVSDYNLEYSTDVVDKIREKYDIDAELYDSFLGCIADMIAATKSTKALTCEEMVEIIEKAKDPENEINNKMTESYEIIKKEMTKLQKDFEENGEKHKNLILYQIKSEYNLSSPLSTRVSEKHKDKIVAIYEISNGKVKMSGRNQGKKFDVAKTFQQACYGLDASAGGHEAAAGATLKEKDWTTFKEKLVKIMNSVL